MPAFEWVHVQLHQQKGMISLSPPTICNSAYQGCLDNNVVLASAAMMKELNTNMTGLNISHAVKILQMQDERVTRNAA